MIKADMIKKFIQFIIFRLKLKWMDEMWHMMGGSCFGMFPPSFYQLHTPEEVRRITEKELSELRAMLDEYRRENGLYNDVPDDKGKGDNE